MSSDQGGKAQSVIYPSSSSCCSCSGPCCSDHSGLHTTTGLVCLFCFLKHHISPREAFSASKKSTGHATRFACAGGKQEKLDKTCWRWWITQRRKWWVSTTAGVFVTVTKQVTINVDLIKKHLHFTVQLCSQLFHEFVYFLHIDPSFISTRWNKVEFSICINPIIDLHRELFIVLEALQRTGEVSSDLFILT